MLKAEQCLYYNYVYKYAYTCNIMNCIHIATCYYNKRCIADIEIYAPTQ